MATAAARCRPHSDPASLTSVFARETRNREAILVRNQAAGWSQELYQATFDRAIPDRTHPPAGLIAHFGAPDETGAWQVIDVWESEDAFRRFVEEQVKPATQELGAPPLESKVVEVYNSLIP